MFIVTDTQKLESYGFEKAKYASNFWTKETQTGINTTIEYGVNPDIKINDNRLVLYALDDEGPLVREDFELLGKMLKDGVIKYVEA